MGKRGSEVLKIDTKINIYLFVSWGTILTFAHISKTIDKQTIINH